MKLQRKKIVTFLKNICSNNTIQQIVSSLPNNAQNNIKNAVSSSQNQ